MACDVKPIKCGLKINFIIGWIDGLGLILWTPRLSEWSRLASLSRRPELTWGHASADPRNSAAFEGPSHLSSILPIFLRLQRSGPRKSGKCELRNYNSAELQNQRSYEAYLDFHFREATSTNSVLASLSWLWIYNSDRVPTKSGNREKVGNFMLGREVGQGKMKYLKISCCMVLNQPGNIQHQNVLTS